MHLKDTRFVVIGVTTRPDATELLEKRIKSRFQLRKIVLSPPDTFEDLVNVLEAVLIGDASADGNANNVASKKKSKKTVAKSQNISIPEKIREVLRSKDLLHHWSLYKDLGYSVREFTTAALTSLAECDSENDIEQALIECMHKVAKSAYGDVAVIDSVVPTLTLRDHVVLVGLLKLHQDGKRPKCFAHVLKEIGSFQKSNAITSTCTHSNRAYWHAFQGLVRQGLIEMIDHPSSPSSPPPMFCRCRLAIGQAYGALFRETDTEKIKKAIIPHELYQWANRERNMQI
jgi:hypothetical protein